MVPEVLWWSFGCGARRGGSGAVVMCGGGISAGSGGLSSGVREQRGLSYGDVCNAGSVRVPWQVAAAAGVVVSPFLLGLPGVPLMLISDEPSAEASGFDGSAEVGGAGARWL